MNSPFYTAEHEAFRQVMRRFVAKEIEPYAHEWDEAGEFPRALYAKAAAIGLLGLGFPEEYGGIPADQFLKIVASQELARAGAGGVSASLMSHTIGSPPIARAARDEVKARVLPEVLSGRKISALAITEPSGGSDVANLRTRARRDGDHYIVNGEKTFITSGVRADYLTVAVRTGGEGSGGVSLLLIEGDTPGLSRTKLKKMGWWASDTATLHFDDCRVPVTNLIGEEGHGFRLIMQNFNSERMGMAASCTAYARVCVEEAIAYAKERKTFGKPIAQHQVIRHKIVDMAQKVAASQAMLEMLAWRLEQGESPVAEICMIEPGHPNHGVLRLRSGADFRWRRLHARHQSRAHLPRGEGQRDRRRHGGDHEGSRQQADGAVTGVPRSLRHARASPVRGAEAPSARRRPGYPRRTR
jgi:acyl-CoA dehydrogenase